MLGPALLKKKKKSDLDQVVFEKDHYGRLNKPPSPMFPSQSLEPVNMLPHMAGESWDEIILHYLGGPNAIIGVPLRGMQKGQSQREKM